MKALHTIGRRKTAKVRLYISQGSGKITINKKDHKDYFPQGLAVYKVLQPFLLTNNNDKFDLNINVEGGGINGQAEAIRLAIARALSNLNPDDRVLLKSAGFLTRDSRKVERKKCGRKKARKRSQFSKR